MCQAADVLAGICEARLQDACAQSPSSLVFSGELFFWVATHKVSCIYSLRFSSSYLFQLCQYALHYVLFAQMSTALSLRLLHCYSKPGTTEAGVVKTINICTKMRHHITFVCISRHIWIRSWCHAAFQSQCAERGL